MTRKIDDNQLDRIAAGNDENIQSNTGASAGPGRSPRAFDPRGDE